MFKTSIKSPRMRNINKIRWLDRLLGAIPVFFILIALLLYFLVIMIPDIKKETRMLTIKELEQVKKEKQVNVLVLTNDLKQGEDVSNAIEIKKRNINDIPKNALLEGAELSNKVTRIDIGKNTLLLESMLINKNEAVKSDIRRQELQYIKLPQDLAAGDIIDIRYRDDTKDNIVVSYKKIENIIGGSIWINRSEKEAQYINIAHVEAKKNNGELYAVVYVEPENQVPAAVNYNVSWKDVTKDEKR